MFGVVGAVERRNSGHPSRRRILGGDRDRPQRRRNRVANRLERSGEAGHAGVSDGRPQRGEDCRAPDRRRTRSRYSGGHDPNGVLARRVHRHRNTGHHRRRVPPRRGQSSGDAGDRRSGAASREAQEFPARPQPARASSTALGPRRTSCSGWPPRASARRCWGGPWKTKLFDVLEDPKPVCDLAHELQLGPRRAQRNPEYAGGAASARVARRWLPQSRTRFAVPAAASPQSLRAALLYHAAQFCHWEALSDFARHRQPVGIHRQEHRAALRRPPNAWPPRLAAEQW